MTRPDPLALDEWYPVAMAEGLPGRPGREARLLGRPLRVFAEQGVPGAEEGGRALPVTVAHGHVWTSLGCPSRDVFAVPEGLEEGRRLVPCGSVRVRCSALRAVENFLDIAHFPFVHADILGAEPHTEVGRYDVRIRDEVDEVWATGISFYQPQAAKSAEGGLTTAYMYRVPHPTSAVLYKTSPPRPGEWDAIALFVQPLSETECEAWPWMALWDDETPQAALIQFQQMILVQDRSILENQVPALLPLDPGMETPTRADLTSVAYRRWLKRRGWTYGAQIVAA